MYKNQLQELAQRSCFNLPSYSCVREGPDHAPRFKATVNFNGETFESPTFCSTLRQAEHAAAEVALNTLASGGPSRALAARVLDETGIYKNLLQETAHRAGLNLPVYTTVRSGPGHVPVFSCTVELAGLSFSGEPAKTKKQAEKNAAMAAWSALKQLAQRSSSSTSASPSEESQGSEEQEQVVIARVLANLRSPEFNIQNEQHGGQPRATGAVKETSPGTSSSFSMQYGSSAYSSFFNEMAMYRMWQQAQLSQLQSRPLSLPMPPALSLNAYMFPFMQSFHHPDHVNFASREQDFFPMRPLASIAASRAPFYVSKHPNPAPTRTRSMVTIQEIQDDKIEGSAEFCPSEVPDIPGITDCKAKAVMQGPAEKDDQTSPLQAKFLESGQLDQNTKGEPDCVPPKFESGVQPVNIQLQNPHSSSSSQFNYRSHLRSSSYGVPPSSSSAAPVRIRTMGPASSIRPQPQHLRSHMPAPPKMRAGVPTGPSQPRMGFRVPSRFMAPPVQIRSVVPVCSAPPPREAPSFNQVGESSDPDKKIGKREDVLAASSELGKLEM